MTATLVLMIAAMRPVIAKALRLTVMTGIPAPMTSAMALPAFVRTLNFHAAMVIPAPMIPVISMAFASIRILIVMMATCARTISVIRVACVKMCRLIAMTSTHARLIFA